MSLMEKIRADQLTARKSKNAEATALLTTLLGEAGIIGKNDFGRETTDDEVVGVIRKFIKNIDFTLEKVHDESARALAQLEKTILESYLPTQLSYDQISSEIDKILLTVDIKKAKGAVMKHFKDNFANLYEAKTILEILDSKQ